mmetsp:Transcript_17974/g.59019  ORF Transcript_17974/g.59019 Transcript_17974/m.59019 type:complete len:212 (-) Transcript_17974:159-794(-)
MISSQPKLCPEIFASRHPPAPARLMLGALMDESNAFDGADEADEVERAVLVLREERAGVTPVLGQVHGLAELHAGVEGEHGEDSDLGSHLGELLGALSVPLRHQTILHVLAIASNRSLKHLHQTLHDLPLRHGAELVPLLDVICIPLRRGQACSATHGRGLGAKDTNKQPKSSGGRVCLVLTAPPPSRESSLPICLRNLSRHHLLPTSLLL